MSRFMTICALLLVAACGRQENESPAASNEVGQTPRAEPAPATPMLEGAWRLAKIDGTPVEGGSSAVATFENGRLRVAAGCNGRGWTFTQKRNIVSFAGLAGASSNCGSLPTVDQERAFHAIDRATIALFDQEGREATLSGDGGNITLSRR
ncbi:META domain-containing protein [Sphingomonas sp. RB56-2]|uniref:META domain-containing protein n=1 Tax=Sphingomonas brevis TaxID=2908206 RepID=A0ABT0SAS9_9SPHN|nr:META domain-containing protein [Sphingomonas brevis]MCL6741521.1 META domain-containing protein [Sphingomonas brevis]